MVPTAPISPIPPRRCRTPLISSAAGTRGLDDLLTLASTTLKRAIDDHIAVLAQGSGSCRGGRASRTTGQGKCFAR
jgi:hypothetical protein